MYFRSLRYDPIEFSLRFNAHQLAIQALTHRSSRIPFLYLGANEIAALRIVAYLLKRRWTYRALVRVPLNKLKKCFILLVYPSTKI